VVVRSAAAVLVDVELVADELALVAVVPRSSVVSVTIVVPSGFFTVRRRTFRTASTFALVLDAWVSAALVSARRSDVISFFAAACW
jgi:hypothetical protein